jgi:multidrug resistance efflux pump
MSETKYIENPEDIRLNEDRELQQILGDPPRQLLHWGNTFVLVGVIIFLTLGWLIKYPDVVPSRVVLTTQEPPIKVFAEVSGKLSEFRIQDNQKVEKGMILAILDNPAYLEDVERLDSFLLKIQQISNDPLIVEFEIPRNLELGNLQKAYSDFSKSFDEHIFFLKNNNTNSKIKNLKEQIKKLEQLRWSLKKQVKTLEQVVDISQRELTRNQKLKAIGSVSDAQLEEAEANLLRNRRQMETLNNEIISNRLLVEQTRMQILEMNQNYDDGRSSGLFSIQEDITNIKSEVDNWKKMYLIKAPISGRVSLTKFRSAQQFINQNEQLLTIVPESANEIIAKGVLPLVGSGKVKSGMTANIRLDGYPYQEFGSIKCEVNNISLVPSGEGFVAELSVPQPFLTTYDRIIPFQQEMQGTANIITEDRRILERIFDRILSILRND